eukprot:TRINITY_DN2549_c0_g1::TRINITY_DN2549_c0_g1_i1::g.19271::m.19271 TRINITY_DN2549_c0_g1::TRINITY_DN2549_c0_g1_i1::g.19271  ORF type:complete len:280 (-),score=17.74,IncA/PF04156.9/0.0032,ATG16/PF08614.6/0.016,TMF_DNA_bd/PF12329.3/0.027,DASH_Spc34/PF08657.5/0.025,DUF4200/PF13863.1/0.04,Cut8_N/PF14482.1/0.11,DivIC/PF04977.10/0.088,Herpes_BLRF2/PF05812.7/0.2,Pox_A_type_inc/PF04508.7/0.88,Pox_A_type_inc/PF04508.7/23 TRINITY_DN2549_c0_g1_i1:81-806(-)
MLVLPTIHNASEYTKQVNGKFGESGRIVFQWSSSLRSTPKYIVLEGTGIHGPYYFDAANAFDATTGRGEFNLDEPIAIDDTDDGGEAPEKLKILRTAKKNLTFSFITQNGNTQQADFIPFNIQSYKIGSCKKRRSDDESNEGSSRSNLTPTRSALVSPFPSGQQDYNGEMEQLRTEIVVLQEELDELRQKVNRQETRIAFLEEVLPPTAKAALARRVQDHEARSVTGITGFEMIDPPPSEQ